MPPLDPDWDTELDFHQALGSLNSYPSLQRALGIVFDFELPKDFVPLTGVGEYAELSVSAIAPGWDWSIKPGTPSSRRPACTSGSRTRRGSS